MSTRRRFLRTRTQTQAQTQTRTRTRTRPQLAISLLSAVSLALAVVSAAAPPAGATAGPELAFMPHVAYLAAGSGGQDPGTPVNPPAVPEEDGGRVALLERSPAYSEPTDEDIAAFDAALESLMKEMGDVGEEEDQVTTEADNLKALADPFNQKITDLNAKIDEHNAKVDALQARINAHNAEPNQFTLPEQQAAADAYQAEATELNNEKSALDAEGNSIQSQIDEINAERSGLLNQLNQLDKDISALEAKITEVQGKQQDLESKRQTLTEEMATDEENALAERAAAAANEGAESPGATDMSDGGDAPQPTDETDPSAQTSTTPALLDDPAVDNSAGGDMPSQSADKQALDSYGRQNGVTVIEEPVTVELPPQALRSMSPSESAQISPTVTYEGVVPEPSGNYKAIEVVSPGSGFTPGQTAFDNAINSGTHATTIVDGRPAVIDATDDIIEPGPAPAPAPAPSGSPTPSPSPTKDDQHKDCRDEPPPDDGGIVQSLPNRGWVEYFPLGPQDRATGMEACLFGADTVGTTRPKIRPAGMDQAERRAGQFLELNPGDTSPLAACHFLAARFGGSNTQVENFTTCWQNPVNVGGAGMSGVETIVKDELGAGMVVEFGERAVYETDKSDTPVEYTTSVFAQKPGTDHMYPIETLPIPNTKPNPITGVEMNIGN